MDNLPQTTPEEPKNYITAAQTAERGMPTAIKKVSDKIEARKQALAAADLEATWDIATSFYQIATDSDQSSQINANSIAIRHGFTNQYKEGLLSLASHIDSEQIDKALEHNKSATGKYAKITSSHMIELSKAPTTEMRKIIFDHMLQYGMSVDNIRENIKNIRSQSKADDKIEEVRPAQVFAALIKLAAKIEDVTIDLESPAFMPAFKDSLQKSKKHTQKVSAQVDEAYSSLTGCVDKMQTVLITLINLQKIAAEMGAVRNRRASEISVSKLDEIDLENELPEDARDDFTPNVSFEDLTDLVAGIEEEND